MARQLTITATEWARVEAHKYDPTGTLWLVRDDGRQCDHHYTECTKECYEPSDLPVEFVQACAPCETCGDSRWVDDFDVEPAHGGDSPMRPCPDCRVELVGSMLVESTIETADFWRTVTLGHACAVGQPLPIVAFGDWLRDESVPPCMVVADGNVYHRGGGFPVPNLTARLAHYGPPELLVGKWALQLAVTA